MNPSCVPALLSSLGSLKQQVLNADNFNLKSDDTDIEFELCCASTTLVDMPQPGWDKVCTDVIGAPVSVWGKFFESPFLQRAEGIVTGRFKEITTDCVELTRTALTSITESTIEEQDLSESLWHSGQIEAWDFGLIKDSTPQPGKVPVGDAVALSAGGFTTKVRKIYGDVDAGLAQVLNDARFFIQAQDNLKSRHRYSRDKKTHNNFDHLCCSRHTHTYPYTCTHIHTHAHI